MNREYHRWYSHRLNRDMELLIFGHAGAKVLIFPTRDGRFYEYENLGLVESLAPKINAGQLQLYCVDSLDHESFYCFWCQPSDRVHRHMQFEEYLLNEVLPLMAKKNNHPCTISHGCSLGAFHAVNFAFRYPHLFQKVVAFSGRYDLTMGVESFQDLFNGHYDGYIYHHTPVHYLPRLSCEWRLEQLRKMDIVLTIGKEDPFLGNNRHLSRLLWEKGVWHALHEWEGRAHRGRYWRQMAPIYV
ncbi:putative esterase [Magnetococcus marinus MC-1]|uniref:Putative esterase n=1 Tax=Magnetococcus marinus (strain ATCC BAA-1437 / JCM 17883 / MC-1) TaxID=156889 RepID=A0LAM6_MAGMM|nr:alpha/beta hydrolase-fold protein [Magnetococcus marinus]ABK45019.1 putative esterase [Magnetococcus marinus MC-1]